MKLIDYFAGQALLASLTGATGLSEYDPEELEETLEEVASICYAAAYYMMQERNKWDTFK